MVVTGEGMGAQAAVVMAGVMLLGSAGCTAPPCGPSQSPGLPASATQDKTAYNNQQVALFLDCDPGWHAWLNAIRASERANNALVDGSRYNTPVIEIIQSVIAAQDAYRVATSFSLPPFTVVSGCGNLYPETNGSVLTSNGLTVRYGFFTSQTQHFGDGSSCAVSIGFIDEVDSSRGMPIVTVDRHAVTNWDESFSHYLVWRQPYWTLSTGTTLSLPDMVGLIER